MKRRGIFTILFAIAFGGLLHSQNTSTTSTADMTTVDSTSTDKYKVETNHFWDNWFISAGAGGLIYFGDHNKQLDLKNRIAPALDISLGKWFTPGIGVRLSYSGLQIKGATQGPHSTGEPIKEKPWDGYWLYYSKYDFYNLHADVLFNLTNLFCGYKESRVYNITPYFGLGWMATWDYPQAHEVSANIGILNSFRLSRAFDIILDIKGSLVNDRFDGVVGSRKQEGPLSATLGIQYNLNRRGWAKSYVRTVIDNREINKLREQVNEEQKANDDLRNQLASLHSKTLDTATIRKYISTPQLIVFQIGKSTLNNQDRVNLGFFAQAIKAGDKQAVYTIIGYADKGTGSKGTNERLSRQRAQVVYRTLIKEFDVSPSQLKVYYKGGVDDMFYNDPRLSRAVITKTE